MRSFHICCQKYREVPFILRKHAITGCYMTSIMNSMGIQEFGDDSPTIDVHNPTKKKLFACAVGTSDIRAHGTNVLLLLLDDGWIGFHSKVGFTRVHVWNSDTGECSYVTFNTTILMRCGTEWTCIEHDSTFVKCTCDGTGIIACTHAVPSGCCVRHGIAYPRNSIYVDLWQGYDDTKLFSRVAQEWLDCPLELVSLVVTYTSVLNHDYNIITGKNAKYLAPHNYVSDGAPIGIVYHPPHIDVASVVYVRQHIAPGFLWVAWDNELHVDLGAVNWRTTAGKRVREPNWRKHTFTLNEPEQVLSFTFVTGRCVKWAHVSALISTCKHGDNVYCAIGTYLGVHKYAYIVRETTRVLTPYEWCFASLDDDTDKVNIVFDN